jgi:predicted PurR-regulated permease PerM
LSQKPPSERQTQILWFALTGLAIATVAALAAATIWGLAKVLGLLSPVLWPLAIAAVVACLLSPLVAWLEQRGLPRTRAILLVFIFAVVLFAGVLASVIPQVVVETRELTTKIPEYSQKIQNRVDAFIAKPPDFLHHFFPAPSNTVTETNTLPAAADNKSTTTTNTWLTEHLPKAGSWLLNQLGKVASGFSMLAGLALVPVYVFYFLVEQRRIESHWRDYLPLHDSRGQDELIFVLASIGQYLVAFFRGQILVALCDAVLYTAGFLMVGVNYAFLLGFAAVFLTIIPYLGAIILCVAALALAFVQHGDWQHPALVLAVFAVVQTLEGLFISPKIMGSRVGLHPLVIIIAVMTGTTLLGGILGGILAIPLAAALRVILARYVWKRKEMA